ncbi:hypothetical protein TTHERM_00393180 (macronuclear) [Tetrahymena thermophila SB210]|uniref:Uncharacterized protein n=1 Tax=Tetrahymena thermophila (strain SB210) TaxID=312017 RepID=Q233D3_TETTS|nr:hypothetical protein TTHERM_00393180 [Tetrahymena thermophila SB210]EAR91647.2 hypothetical protein TTHERM_00393180 [Tetrahymena thermophila SB210]|eukprot:XP_001011892.2 hypothetical protein TTHERM_00393180 [Tetrahymena thermophila SB210]
MHAVRFELTRIAPTQLECAALDRSATRARQYLQTKTGMTLKIQFIYNRIQQIQVKLQHFYSQQFFENISLLQQKLEDQYNKILYHFSPKKCDESYNLCESQSKSNEESDIQIEQKTFIDDGYLERMAEKRKLQRQKNQKIKILQQKIKAREEVIQNNEKNIEQIQSNRKKITFKDIILEEYERQTDPNFYMAVPHIHQYVQKIKNTRIQKQNSLGLLIMEIE